MPLSLEQYHKLLADVICPSDDCPLGGLPIDLYAHDGGWLVKGYSQRQWLSVRCPRCCGGLGYDWSLWKLGIPGDLAHS